jgi:hypothetical protein
MRTVAILTVVLALVPLSGTAAPNTDDRPGMCIVPMASMNRALRARISPRALCRDTRTPPAAARPIEVTPQSVSSAAGSVAVEYVALQSANAWLGRGWAMETQP